MADKKEKKKFKIDLPSVEEIVEHIPSSYEYGSQKQAIGVETKKLYATIHMEGVSALEEIADKYTRKAKYSEDQLGKFSGKEGLIDFFKKLTADVGHPYQHGEDRHQLYHTLREAITLSGGKEHLSTNKLMLSLNVS